MKRIIKKTLGAVCVLSLACSLFTVTADAKKTDDYSSVTMSDIEAGAEGDKTVEAETIFGNEKVSTNIDVNSKSDTSAKKSSSSSKKNSSNAPKKLDSTPKTGIDDIPVYVPILLAIMSLAGIAVLGVSIIGKRTLVRKK